MLEAKAEALELNKRDLKCTIKCADELHSRGNQHKMEANLNPLRIF